MNRLASDARSAGLVGVAFFIACGGNVASTLTDAGKPARDGGTPPIDGGEPVEESGVRRDVGVPDGKTPPVDAGRDSGSSPDAPKVTEVPTNHRPNDSQCSAPAAAGDCMAPGGLPDGSTQFLCASDGDCTQGKSGRCNDDAPAPFAGCHCAYDACTHDTDCPSGNLCVCHGSPYAYGAGNTCMPGNCRVDADCGANGYCSPSEGTVNCGAVAGYFCHTASDTCVNDSDCGGTFDACIWSSTDNRWECQESEPCA